jgi:hypothetical protein
MIDLDPLISQIKSNEFFLKLKDVVENIEGFHDKESVYDHSLKAADAAKKIREGEFITNPGAKKLFSVWLDEEISGMKRKDIVVLAALLHDCGKILKFKEGEKSGTLSTSKPNSVDQTYAPGHDYYGAQFVVPEILKDTGLDKKIIDYISSIVRLHSTLNDPNFYSARSGWNREDLISLIKSLAEGFWLEELFNAYSDNFFAHGFESARKKIIEIFNESSLYIPRSYFIP